ncbi:hypothetical protein [Clostridium estertheticum]|uniref:Uncharacterized protein n=2 Tax=Clostridium estertheticum TaxID=238834 RepID=A0A1J0GJ74_9CLOT|nr:hypothetical protein [Clostridium estertheticum]APC40984.1 hypothetical protein A7L45_13325 [Clostridium estertheticum subsp. estertheticum]MBU3074048.1 hypothetical protein [Clostridium estertheticum]MBU3153864.1 hypothetical protein [Clostridium estertheticum]MBU3164142.1 hypothetical protein [Clostridium estertheticum]MBU3170078.1 hypothetical protein [Clostridium estertheticum]
MVNEGEYFINKGYKIMKFERDIDKITGQEIGTIEVKALDGHRQYITFDDNGADEIEKSLFEYLKNK